MAFELSYVERGSIRFLTSESLLEKKSILVVFTTRVGGVSPPPYNTFNLGFHVGDREENVIKNREILCRSLDLNLPFLTTAEQVHGDRATVIKDSVSDSRQKLVGRGASSDGDAIPETDALLTNLEKIPLTLFFADCVPIVLVDAVKRAVAVIHSGRKGTQLDITSKTVKRMQNVFNCKPQELLAFIGPAIGPCCYEIDLPGLNVEQLEGMGVSSNNIFYACICTSCNVDLFFSYQAENRRTGRQAALVTLL